jgi:hypothetical protein
MRTERGDTYPERNGRKIAWRFFGWGLAVAVCLSAAQAAPPLDPHAGYVMVPEHARDLLRQCSRATPDKVQGVWTPSAAQIAEFETRLPPALAQVKPQHHAGYGRQYGGLIVGGRRLIYVNAFPAGALEDMDKDRATWADKATHQAFVVCDGGEDFFGALYDPATKTFSEFKFNGFA